jgi:transportin-3
MAAAATQVVAAINALYKDENSSVRQEADRWLEAWQGTTEAWSVANGLLHDPASTAEVTYFCAQTLKTKVGVGC